MSVNRGLLCRLAVQIEHAHSRHEVRRSAKMAHE